MRQQFQSLAICLVVLLISVRTSLGEAFQPVSLATESTGSKHISGVWSDSVVWLDFRAGSSGMYRYQFSTGTEERFQSTTRLGHDYRDGVLSYGAGRPQTYNLDTNTTHDLDTRNDRFVYTSLGSKWVAWSSSSVRGEYDVRARRIAADGTPVGDVVLITDKSGVQTHVATDGEYVAWRDTTDGGIWLRNMIDGNALRIRSGNYPTVHDGRVAWKGNGIWVHDIEAESTTQISTISSRGAPGLWGDQIVWASDGFLFGQNLESGNSFAYELPSIPGYTTPFTYGPQIYENTVVWAQRQRPLGGGEYVYELYAMQIPEPSSLALQGLGIIALLTVARNYKN